MARRGVLLNIRNRFGQRGQGLFALRLCLSRPRDGRGRATGFAQDGSRGAAALPAPFAAVLSLGQSLFDLSFRELQSIELALMGDGHGVRDGRGFRGGIGASLEEASQQVIHSH